MDVIIIIIVRELSQTNFPWQIIGKEKILTFKHFNSQKFSFYFSRFFSSYEYDDNIFYTHHIINTT